MRAAFAVAFMSNASFAFSVPSVKVRPRAFATASPADTCTQATDGAIVTIACLLEPEGDFVPEPLFDGIAADSGIHEPTRLTFCLGGGNYLPGMHEVIKTMQVGEKIEKVPLDAGWGGRDDNLVAKISFEAMGGAIHKEDIKVGVQLRLSSGAVCVVTDVEDDGFTVDANPPLAGTSYLATIELLRVDPGPEITVYPAVNRNNSPYEVATFALGCFWGGELEFMRQPGVVGTQVGYTQGSVEEPTYQQVCSGETGHTEAILVKYDPSAVSYEQLVHVAMDRLGGDKFLLNQVGNDKGTQYRHGVYYHTDEQKEVAERIVASYGDDCVTECLPAKKFYFAEDYHQQYLLKGGQSARKGDITPIRCYG